jgi:arsenate reductase
MAGIDISNHRSKSIDEFIDMGIDYAVTVCDSAKETCPVRIRPESL